MGYQGTRTSAVMQPNYHKLAEQYGGFLVAIGGVSITVLTLVLSAWRILRRSDEDEQRGGKSESSGESEATNNRPALVISLIIATFCSFVGAQLMAEMVALETLGQTHFLLASVNIFIAVAVVIFAVMLLATEYRRDNRHMKGIRQMARRVFYAVLVSVFSWMIYSAFARMPAPHRWLTPLTALAVGYLSFIYFRDRSGKNGKKLNENLLDTTFVAVIGFTVVSLLGFLLFLLIPIWPFFQGLTVWFFVFAITFTCLGLWFSARCVAREEDEGYL
jgi:heme/copper-type cytochrome/quinol oxidase subunit 2